MLLSRKTLQRILGFLWLIDGLLQLEPLMFTGNMINSVMRPMLEGQPAFLEPSLRFIVDQTTLHLAVVNVVIAVVQIGLGLGFLLLSERWVKELVIASIVWALIVWYGGEGMSMLLTGTASILTGAPGAVLLTGTASILTGAPGAVLLYPLLGFAVYPRRKSDPAAQQGKVNLRYDGLLTRTYLRWILSGFWFFAALLQLQPNWWQPGQISDAIGGVIGQGGFDTVLVDPVLQRLSDLTANIEIPLNIALIVVFLALGIGLAVARREQLRAVLIASIVVSVIIWYCSQALGMIMTGMSTDFNSGLLIVVMALACWPKAQTLRFARSRFTREVRQKEESEAAQRV